MSEVKEKKLTPREQAFIEFYAINPNATEAAKSAGYSEKTAKVIGYENLTKPYIQEALKKLTKPAQEARLATLEQRRELLRKIAMGEENDTAIVQGVEIAVAPKMSDRLKALDLLGKTHGDYLEKMDMTSDGKPIQPTKIVLQAVAAKIEKAKKG